MKIAINDTNILIDFYDINLIDDLMKIDLEMHTTDFVINEIEPFFQQQKINDLISSHKLKVQTFSSVELLPIIEKNIEHPSLSLTDCSVLHWAEINDCVLLTGDGSLRKKAIKKGIEVHGTLWLLDELLRQKIIKKNRACKGILDLVEVNKRLPQEACEQRKKVWCGG